MEEGGSWSFSRSGNRIHNHLHHSQLLARRTTEVVYKYLYIFKSIYLPTHQEAIVYPNKNVHKIPQDIIPINHLAYFISNLDRGFTYNPTVPQVSKYPSMDNRSTQKPEVYP